MLVEIFISECIVVDGDLIIFLSVNLFLDWVVRFLGYSDSGRYKNSGFFYYVSYVVRVLVVKLREGKLVGFE